MVGVVRSHTLTFRLWKVLPFVIMSLTSARRVCEHGVLSVNSCSFGGTTIAAYGTLSSSVGQAWMQMILSFFIKKNIKKVLC